MTTMNRRNLLKTFLAAPAIIRQGVLKPVVPLVAAPVSGIALLRQHEMLTGTEVLRRQGLLDGLDVGIVAPPDIEAEARKQFVSFMQSVYADTFERALSGRLS